MDAIQKRALIKKRAVIKSRVTRLSSFVTNFQVGGNIQEIKVRRKLLSTMVNDYDEIQTQLEVDDSEDGSHDDDREAFDDLHLELESKMETLLLAASTSPTPFANNANSSSSSSVVRLPTISLPKFSGALQDFMHFNDTFVALIINNDTLTDIQRYYYLLSCLSGEPHQLIENLPVSQENFKVAWNLVRSRYHNPRLISDLHVKELLSLPNVRHDSPKDLRLLINQLCSNLNAIEALKIETPLHDMMLSHLILERISVSLRKQWEINTSSEVSPSLKALVQFLENNCQTLEIVTANRNVTGHIDEPKRGAGAKGPRRSFVTMSPSCPLCHSSHTIHKCSRFKNLDVNGRIKVVKDHNLCFNCLRGDHMASDCKSGNCRTCNRKHHTLLHIERSSEPVAPSSRTDSQHQSYCSVLDACPTNEVLLSTAVVNIKDSQGRNHQCRALLDSASQMNFVSRDLVERLGLKLNRYSMSINGISNIRATESSHICQLQITSRVGSYSKHILCSVLPRITGPLPSSRINYKDWQLPADIPLADPNFHHPRDIDLLLGATVFFEILRPEQQCKPAHPTLQNTQLGWLLSGCIPAHSVQQKSRATTSLLTTSDNLHKQVERFWLQEEITSRHHSREESLCEEHFLQSYARDATGRFSVRLPLRQDEGELGDSIANAKRNFGYLERKLQRQPDLKTEYIKFMEEYRQLGHMELVNPADQSQYSYYMPHHAVVKDTSSTTKVRVVFNASAKTTSSLSLNELMMVGPTIQQDLFSIVLRFRTHKHALTADIEKMYRQIQMKETDRDLQRIVWRRCPSHRLESYRLTTVTYGTAAAPYLATRCLLQVALDGQLTYPTAADVIKEDFYVDDLLTGTDTVEEAVQLYKDVTSLLNSGGFPIRKWRSNNPNILRAIPATFQDNKVPCSLPFEDSAVKTLGLHWVPSSDLFQFCVVDSKYKNATWTKRTVLGNVASIYDPLGLLGPVIVLCKLLIQNLWHRQLDWDSTLPSELAMQWIKIHRQLPELNKIRIPRRVTADGLSANVELHGFSDASERAYGACVYLRCTDNDGIVTIHLLASKSRVAPLKQVSLPRLELNGALLLSQLMVKVHRALNLHISQQWCWTDSTVVLAWIAGRSTSWKTYVANRVAEIQRLATQQHWRHVNSQNNPADIISRGVDPGHLQDNQLWWAGPPWLAEDPSTWPAIVTANHDEIPEQRRAQLCFIATYPEIENYFGQFSSWSRLQRVIAYVIRFIYNVKQEVAARRHGPLTSVERRESLTLIIRIVQHSTYAQEVQALQQEKPIPSSSKLLPLHPFLDGDNLLRVGGRLENSEAPFDQKHPMIMPPKHHVTKLLIWNEHIKLLHAGSQLLLASLRQRFWITAGRSVIRQVTRKCVTCFKTKAKLSNQLMGQLPVSRVTPSKPFSHCGIDYGGPLRVKYGNPRTKTHIKCYIALFVCMSTKAVHIELVSNLTTEAFIAALRRFISRRGRCHHIYSDNGTCFTGAKKKLDELSRFLCSQDHQSVIANTTAEEGMEWHLIPPHSPHFGGLWEAGIKSVKSHLRKIAGNIVLTFEEMTTLLTQIEACLNSRPIVPIPTNPDEYTFLTPGHFLIGESLTSFPEPDCLVGPSSRLSRWQLVQRCRALIWKRWSADYLGQLQQRSKWLTNQPNLQPGRLVLLKEDNALPLTWPTGIIERTHPGSDGLVRVVTVRTSKGSYKRPITKLCIFPDELH